MSVSVRIPTVLRPAVGGVSVLSVDGANIGEVLGAITTAHPGVQMQLFNEDGTLHRFLNVYVNDDDVRYLGGLSAPTPDGAEVTLLPAVAGGAI
jgi:molybdopterin converting factor small subunit